jgi:transcriptional regulator with XRE-family HTH domain
MGYGKPQDKRAYDGKPEVAAQRFGEIVARLRTRRGWSRPRLVAQIYRVAEETKTEIDFVSEAWLARLEAGRMVKVPRVMVEVLCRALKCTLQERVELLVSADRNVLSDTEGTASRTAQVLNYLMVRLFQDAEGLYQHVEDLLTPLLHNRQLSQISDEDLEVIVYTVLAAIIDEHSNRTKVSRTSGNSKHSHIHA